MSDAPVSRYWDVSGIPWEERRPGVHWRVLYRDGNRQTVLVRYDPGAVIPCHRHIGDEQIFVLEGEVEDDTGVCRTGHFARRPPSCVHTCARAGHSCSLMTDSPSRSPVARGLLNG